MFCVWPTKETPVRSSGKNRRHSLHLIIFIMICIHVMKNQFAIFYFAILLHLQSTQALAKHSKAHAKHS